MPLEPPTLRPITGEPQWPCKCLKLDDDLSDSTAQNINCTNPPASPPPILHMEGQAVANGLPELGSPQRVTTGGVGRRTSVLFKKAKNRDRDGLVLNGNSMTAPSSAASTPSSTPLSTPSKTPQKSPTPLNLNEKWTPSKDSNTEPETLESGEKLSI